MVASVNGGPEKITARGYDTEFRARCSDVG
jgi:hypothetical protein